MADEPIVIVVETWDDGNGYTEERVFYRCTHPAHGDMPWNSFPDNRNVPIMQRIADQREIAVKHYTNPAQHQGHETPLKAATIPVVHTKEEANH